jgi:hypothetical protein
MTPPRWVDEHGQPSPTRPCPTCGRVIPIKRWPVLRTGAIRHRPYDVLSVNVLDAPTGRNRGATNTPASPEEFSQ